MSCTKHGIICTGNHSEIKVNVENPNRLLFRGVLTFIERPSERAPTGGRGHKVTLSRRACESALHTLIGMGINYADGNYHDAQKKVGIITAATIVGDHIEVLGHLWAKDFPSEVATIAGMADKMGMSYEISNVRVADLNAPTWRILECTFTGAAILLGHKAAYRNTSVSIIGIQASADNRCPDPSKCVLPMCRATGQCQTPRPAQKVTEVVPENPDHKRIETTSFYRPAVVDGPKLAEFVIVPFCTCGEDKHRFYCPIYIAEHLKP